MHLERDPSGGVGDTWEPWLADLERNSDIAALHAVLNDLWRFPFHAHRGRHPENWSRLFSRLVELIDHDNSQVRELADHYARIVIGEQRDLDVARRQIAALLPALARRIERGEISLLRCIDELAHVEDLTDVGPQEIVERWIEASAANPAQALAARIGYLASRDGARAGAHSVESLVDRLDHDDDMVRAYAAQALGDRYAGSDPDERSLEPLPEFLAKLTAKEIERPGIAGPFLSNWYDHGLGEFEERSGLDLRDWLITILAQRKRPEPNLLPCSNGIDFFAHELFGSSPEHVRRLIDLGHDALAVEAATELDGPFDEMLPLLVELAGRPDPEVCRRASWHLAAEYRQLHADGAARGFVRRHTSSDGADLWTLLSQGSEETLRAYAATIFPTGRASFSEEEAAAAVEAVLPSAIRGQLQPFEMPGDGGQPGLWIHGTSANARYSSGAIVQFRGDVASRRWERIRILWHGQPGAWRPESPA